MAQEGSGEVSQFNSDRIQKYKSRERLSSEDSNLSDRFIDNSSHKTDFSKRKDVEEKLPKKTHPDFPNSQILHDQTGASWLDAGSNFNYVYGPFHLENFRLSDVVTNREKPLRDTIKAFEPLREQNRRFFDASAFENVSDISLSINPKNVNADLGTQERMKLMVERGVIDEHTFVILSHGHFAAGLAELSAATTPDNRYMFDTAMYFPRGQWSPENNNPESVAKQELQLWSEVAAKAKREHVDQQRAYAGGIAVGLFGHRGRFDFGNIGATAAIKPENLLGKVEECAAFLKDHGLNKVVIVTEESDISPDYVSSLPLDRLKEGMFGDENKDLFGYFQALASSGVEVKVVSGDTRPAVGYLGKKLAEEDRQREGK